MGALGRLFALALVTSTVPAWSAEWNTPESRARWGEISADLFGPGINPGKTDRLVRVDAPSTAADATLVPVTLTIAPELALREIMLVVDQNPAPLAAKIAFGPAGDARQIKLRVRVDNFTNMHAVAATHDGRLLQNVAFVKGAGGCSAPMGMSVAEASVGMGEMRMKFSTNTSLDAPQATLMIRHPNFSGMQKDSVTKTYTPARYIQSVVVKRGNRAVFDMTSDISLSSNPVIEFLYRPAETGPFTVTAVDSGGSTWTQDFAPPQTMN